MESSIELKKYAAVLRKRVWLIVACVVAVTGTTGIYSYFFTDPLYQASSKIIVNKSKDSNEMKGHLELNDVNLNIQLVNTYKEIIKTYAVMDRVVENHPELGLTADQLIGKIEVSNIVDSQIMVLSVQDRSYEDAIKIVNTVTSVFKETIPTIMNVDNVEILSQAKKAYDVSPNPTLNIIIGFIVSLMVSVGAAFLLEYLDDTVKTEADIAGLLGVPTFAVVAVITRKDLVTQDKITNKPDLEGAPYATVNS